MRIHRREEDCLIGYEPAGAYLAVDEEGLDIINTLKKHTLLR